MKNDLIFDIVRISFDSIGRFKAQMSVVKILGTVSSPNSHDGETFRLEKRALLNIDLNVAPPEDGGFDTHDGGNSEEIRPSAAEDDNGFCIVEDEEKGTKSMNIVADSEEKDRRIRGWNTLLEVAENALLEHQQNLLIKGGGEFQNLSRKTGQESEPGCELTRKRTTGPQHRNDETAAAAPVVVRSTRGRALAMPNKYRDSVLDAVAMAEAELPRHNKSGKSATVASTKRKSR